MTFSDNDLYLRQVKQYLYIEMAFKKALREKGEAELHDQRSKGNNLKFTSARHSCPFFATAGHRKRKG